MKKLGCMALKFAKLLTNSIAALLFAVAPVQAQDTNLQQTIDSALKYSEDQKFNVALAILEQANAADKQNYDYMFAKARILTWARKYGAAETEYQKLLASHPDDPDVMVSYGYMQLFSGNLMSAEAYFTQVLAAHPAYMDAQKGLKRTKELNKTRKIATYKPPEKTSNCPYGFEEISEGVCGSSN